MSYINDFRPTSFDDFLGAPPGLEALLKTNNHPHTYMFTGDSGCGKTTMARIVGAFLDAEIVEYNSANFRGIDTARDIIYETSLPNILNTTSLRIMDEFHKTTNDAQNALLKVLEEPPSSFYFIICTTEPEKIIKAIHNRCTAFNFTSLNDMNIYKLLKKVKNTCHLEVDNSILDLVVENCGGNPRAALKMFEKIKEVTDPNEQKKIIDQIWLDDESEAVIQLCRALTKSDITSIIECIKVIQKEKIDVEKVRRTVLSYLTKVVMSDPNKVSIIVPFLEPWYNSGLAGLLAACLRGKVWK